MKSWLSDPRAVLAIIAVIGAFALQWFLIVTSPSHDGEVPSIPTWSVATVSAIVFYFFGSRNGSK